jgi:chorismate mutase/prephenate dehydratase
VFLNFFKKNKVHTLEPYSYGHIATTHLTQRMDIIHHKNHVEIFEAILQEQKGYVVLPIKNTIVGNIQEVLKLVTDYSDQFKTFRSIKSYDLPVCHCICTSQEITSLKEITTFISHPKALRQCKTFFENSGITKEQLQKSHSTSHAAQQVSVGKDSSIAAICSEDAAKYYNLQVFKCNIQDIDDNVTTFELFNFKK